MKQPARVNQANGKGSITIYISEGIYGLDATATFHPANWHFSKDNRLTIRASVLPDDADWNPGIDAGNCINHAS